MYVCNLFEEKYCIISAIISRSVDQYSFQNNKNFIIIFIIASSCVHVFQG